MSKTPKLAVSKTATCDRPKERLEKPEDMVDRLVARFGNPGSGRGAAMEVAIRARDASTGAAPAGVSPAPIGFPQSEIQALRHRMGLDPAGFAKVVGVDARTVARWELGAAHPTGAAEAVLFALREKLNKDPAHAEKVIAFIVGAAAVGGLAYLLVKLLDEVTEDAPGGGS
jgi:DNA-binding transcriptional regulator YiaG